jgi:EAL domain-containing protein (putative c-di-GMP-specific phosphodiesterase class I)
VRAIIGLGKSLDLPVVADGTETFRQHRIAIENGRERLQDFLLVKRKSAGEVDVVSRIRPASPLRCQG